MINLIIPCVLLIAEIYFHISYSGIPYLSNKLKDRVSTLNRVIFFWAIGRIIQGTVGIVAFSRNTLILDYINGLQESSSSGYFQDLLYPALFLLDAFLCEIFPLFMILDTKKLELFLLNSEIASFSTKQRLIDDDTSFDKSEEQEKVFKKEISLQSRKLSEDKDILEINPSPKTSFEGQKLFINSKDKHILIDNKLVIFFLYHFKLILLDI